MDYFNRRSIVPKTFSSALQQKGSITRMRSSGL
jgi:hypothetical protein